jgi:CheY-like chemotaxis protein
MPRGAETVLLVEDEEPVRLLTRQLLEQLGYRVLTAGLGREALQLSAQHAGPIHLLLSDVVMPHMAGRELAQRLISERPHLRVLFMSGYTDDVVAHHGVQAAGAAFLHKPFTPGVLAGKVREVLDGDGSAPHN